MDVQGLFNAELAAKKVLIDALKEFVLKNGEEMCSYYYNEFGMYEEDDGLKIVKVLNLFDNGGCFFAVQDSVCDRDLSFDIHDSSEKIWDNIALSFGFSTFWSIYLVRDAEGYEELKYYRFYNSGVQYDNEGSEPDHDSVEYLTLNMITLIYNAVEKNFGDD